jgi:acyl carrier protein
MGIEEEFDLTVDTDSIENIVTVGQALDLIKAAVEGA